MSKDDEKTKPTHKVEKVAADSRGRSVWLGKIEPIELELVSTQMLEKLLETGGDKARSEIRELAAGQKEGVLAREAATGSFRILSDADLKEAGAATPQSVERPQRADVVSASALTDAARTQADQLSLVSTQTLRKVVKSADMPQPEEAKQDSAGRKDKFGGFNPYDNS